MRTLCHYVIKNWFSEHSFRSIIDPKIAEIGKFSRTNQQRKVLHEGKKTMNANRDIELFSGFFEQIKQNGMKKINRFNNLWEFYRVEMHRLTM